jgi:hypothetical protein
MDFSADHFYIHGEQLRCSAWRCWAKLSLAAAGKAQCIKTICVLAAYYAASGIFQFALHALADAPVAAVHALADAPVAAVHAVRQRGAALTPVGTC